MRVSTQQKDTDGVRPAMLAFFNNQYSRTYGHDGKFSFAVDEAILAERYRES